MKAIWKFGVPVTDAYTVDVPKGAVFHPTAASEIPGTISLWAEVDPTQPKEPRTILVLGTGNPMPERVSLRYLATVQDRIFFWHVYEVRS